MPRVRNQPSPVIACLSLLVAAVAIGGAGPLELSAPDLVAPDGRLVRPTKFENACGQSLSRFCPDLASTPGQTRSQVICLKPYRTSLPFGCRAAVNAALSK